MGIVINHNAVNQVDKNTTIYLEGEHVKGVAIILKGRVLAKSKGTRVVLGTGNFIGASDLSFGRYLCSYEAFDEVLFYSFPVQRMEEVADIFTINKDYKGLMSASLSRYVAEIEKIYSQLRNAAEDIYEFADKYHGKYMELGSKLGYSVNPITALKELEPYNEETLLDDKKLEYYKESARISVDTWKSFCSYGEIVALYTLEDTQEIISQMLSECSRMSDYLESLLLGLISNSDNCLYKSYASLAINIEETGGDNRELIRVVDAIVERINYLEKTFEEKLGRKCKVDRKRMEEIYYMLISKSSNRKEQVENNFQYTEDEAKEVTETLQGALQQICVYALYDTEKADEMAQGMLDFINLRDKFSTDDRIRILRRKLTQHFYELYESVFLKACRDGNAPKIIDLFLKYGFLDERLLTTDQIRELYFLDDEMLKQTGHCKVYDIKTWLTCIYKGEKEPSKNEFDQEYVDWLRNNRKRGEITEEGEKEALTNPILKVKYEMQNMFRYNSKVVNGQFSTFVPFLWGESIVKSFQNMLLTPERINSAVNNLLEVDYSIFHREILYVNQAKGIAKEYLMQPVYPDIILMPVMGYHGVMWQEITGKKKSREGRFIFPMFADANFNDMLIKVCGKFRWELCRSIQGNAWNNIKEKSLTSEYADYIQFYRKNRDISEEMREKIKAQIQKGRNNYREIFVIDYEGWVKGEATGAVKLNRIAREILATYCPFKKEIREHLKGMPLFAEAMERHARNTIKKIKDTELRYRALEKDGGEVIKELKDTLDFYKSL
ncbi:cyclic nucleotide-binding domain-containing protein [Anaerocolumna xylanovorans]|uniref:cAMP-binding domain of CRP or a regulatory subunit of cAMP-dependent protein kinases n=1 Tax=Anaerocolumna xylanovorans DSM 12503 TaxID=1121345 RepID=A0A1M7YKH1_9FIRM|nr:hypothetical protein [Anaerocolumna xylanovorans]SHO53038.1 cAMP-binding domain of CRP or a regulatory subunit of cAMP-dependent protein kinases [Anaerocolumna xylanovorans DSM 12503]